VLTDLDETLRQLLIRDIPIDGSNDVDVSFETPDRDWSGRLSRDATVNCFLYDIRENHEYRETDYRQIERHNGTFTRRKSPIRMDVYYYVTVWTRDTRWEHDLVWRVAAALLRHTVLPDELLQGELKRQPFPLRAQSAQPELGPKNAADLWHALDNRIRPGLCYVVTLGLDPEVAFTGPRVFTRVDKVRHTAEGQDAHEALTIGGRVRDRRDPAQGIADAYVRLRETGARATTDAEGHFRLWPAHRGKATLEIARPGGKPTERPIDIPSPDYDVEV
jgi:hypothetical protein